MSLNSPLLPPALRSLVQEFSKLPGVGERSALRYAMSLLRSGKRHIDALKTAVEGISHSIETCPKCHFWMEDENCAICEDDHRQNDRLCVVRDCPDV